MIYMFNELSIHQVTSISESQKILESFIIASIRAKELGFTEIRLHENSLQNLYQLPLFDGYRIDNWLSDKDVNSDLKDSFREIISTYPLITNDEISEMDLFERSEFHKYFDGINYPVFGLGAAYVFDTLVASLATHVEWLNSSVSIVHFSLNHDGHENVSNVDVRNFSSLSTIEVHKKWIEDEQRASIDKSIDLWVKRDEYLPHILLGKDIEGQLQKIGLTKKFSLVFQCLKKLDIFSKQWTKGGFNLNELKKQTLLNISGESECTMQKFSTLRKFHNADGKKVQFELHIKLPDIRIYFLPNERTHKITVGYIGKHLRTCLYD